jgi:hypothetical protein
VVRVPPIPDSPQLAQRQTFSTISGAVPQLRQRSGMLSCCSPQLWHSQVMKASLPTAG